MTGLVDNGPPGPLRHLYVHVPFCRDRCTYCAFATLPDDPGLHAELIGALLVELRSHQPPAGLLATVSIGGGTPGQLTASELGALLTGIEGWQRRAPACETTLEVNPSNVTLASLRAWDELGIDRVSVGVQTFHDHALRQLARRHDETAARAALAALTDHGPRSWSVDLLVGWAGQSLTELDRDLDILLAYEPPHISVYGLTVEPRTALASQVARDPAVVAPPDLTQDLDARWSERLSAAGYERYEVSNWARPGHRCRHNEAYWTNAEYLGLGPGAASSIGDLRWSNIISTRVYLDHIRRFGVARERVERLTPGQRLIETLAVGLRRREGVERAHLDARFGPGWKDEMALAYSENHLFHALDTSEQALKIQPGSLSIADAITRSLAVKKTPS